MGSDKCTHSSRRSFGYQGFSTDTTLDGARASRNLGVMSMWSLSDVFPLWSGEAKKDASPERTFGTFSPESSTAGGQEQSRGAPTDAVLAALRNGELKPFESFFLCEYTTLVDFASSITGDVSLAEDVVSDAFLWIYHHRASIILTGSLIAYTMGVVRHRALDAVRSHRRRQARHARLAQEQHASVVPACSGNPETDFIDREASATLQVQIAQTLAQCSASSRTAFLLRARQGLAFAEIGQILGISENAAKKQVGRVVRMLRVMIPGLID